MYETLRGLSAERLAAIQEGVSNSFLHEGIFFTVYGDEEAQERIIPVDCVPRIVPAVEWRLLDAGLSQRLRALNLFLQDVYTRRASYRTGSFPKTSCMSVRSTVRRCGVTPPLRLVGGHLRNGPAADA